MNSSPRTCTYNLPGILQLMAGAALISFSAVFVKIVQTGPTISAFYRMLFGAIILFMVVAIKKDKIWHGVSHFMIIIVCSVFFTLDLSFWHRSILYVGPGLATLLANCQVFFLAGFSLLSAKETLGTRISVSIPLAMTGLYLIVGHHPDQLSQEYHLGILFGLIAALSYAAFIICLRKIPPEPNSPGTLINIALISTVTCVLLGFEALVQGESFRIPDLRNGVSLMGYALISQVIGWFLISRAVGGVKASQIGLILLLQPTLSFVWDILFFSRPTAPIEVLGAALTMLAIYLGTAR